MGRLYKPDPPRRMGQGRGRACGGVRCTNGVPVQSGDKRGLKRGKISRANGIRFFRPHSRFSSTAGSPTLKKALTTGI